MLKFIKIFVIVISILIAIMLFFVISNIKNKNFNWDFAKNINIETYMLDPSSFDYRANYVKEYSYKKNKVNRIEVKSDIFDIYLNDSSDDNIHVKLDLQFGAKDQELLDQFKKEVIKKSDYSFGKVLVEVKIPEEIRNDYKFKHNAATRGKITISIPFSFKLKDLDINVVSGNTTIENENLITDSLNLNIVSGNISIKNISSDEINLNFVSGNINIDKVESINCYSHGVSGDVKIDNFKGEKLNIDTVSGDIKINKLSDIQNVFIKTISGDIYTETVKDFEKLQRIELSSISGNINSTFPLEIKRFLKIYIKSTSGDIHTGDFKVLKGNEVIFNGEEAKTDLNIKTISGDVNINFR